MSGGRGENTRSCRVVPAEAHFLAWMLGSSACEDGAHQVLAGSRQKHYCGELDCTRRERTRAQGQSLVERDGTACRDGMNWSAMAR